MNIAMIGAGKMGLPMSGHFRNAGHHVTVFDTGEAQLAAARAAGLHVAVGLEVAIAEADVIFSSLPNDAALLAVAAQVAAAAKPGAIYVDTSTVSLQASAKAASLCDARAIAHVRATVSGNNKMAEAANLTVMASGPRAAYDQVLPALALLGPSQFYVGQADEARLMKLVINLIIGGISGLLAEGLTLGEKGGLDWKQMWDVIASSAVAAPIVKAKAVDLRNRDYTPTFTVPQMLKDVGLILDAGAQLGAPLALTALVNQQLHAAIAQGDAALDYAAIIRVEERAAGLKVS